MINIPTVASPPVMLGGAPQGGTQQCTQTIPQGGGQSVTRGQKVSLSKMNPNLDRIQVCLGWDVGYNTNYDLDASAFMLGSNGKVVSDNHFVFYSQPMSPCGSVSLSGDNKTGQGDGDDEILNISLSRVPIEVTKIVFVVTINEALQTGKNFGQVKNAFARVVDVEGGRELVNFQLTEYYPDVTSMMVGELYRHGSEWKFTPIGMGTQDDLAGLCARYGVDVE